MPPAAYAVWVLVLQTAAYVGYLNFGLQTAIGRYVAYAQERDDIEQRDSVFSTAFVGLCGAALLSLLCLAVAIVATPSIFPSVPSQLIPQMRLALLLVGFSMAVELPASSCNGVFIGMQRYEIPALTVGGARLLSAVGVVAAALAGRSLVVMAAIIAAANLLSYLAQYVALRRIVPDVRFQPSLVRRSTARELYGYCWGLTVMSFSMLLVPARSGSGGPLRVRSGGAVLGGRGYDHLHLRLASAIINVVMPHAATLHAREKAEDMGRLVVSSTRLSALLLILSGIPIFLYAGPIIHLWIGQRYVASGAPLLAILVVANIIRLIGMPYAVIMVAAGQQNYIKVSPLSEGLSDFVASVVLGSLLGGIGVALGTLVGSIVGIISHLWYPCHKQNG